MKGGVGSARSRRPWAVVILVSVGEKEVYGGVLRVGADKEARAQGARTF
jgi:hypothetical protein